MEDGIFERYTPLHGKRDLYVIRQFSQGICRSHAVVIGKRYQAHQIQLGFNLLAFQFESRLGRHRRPPVRRGKIHGPTGLFALFVESPPQDRPLLGECRNELQVFFGEMGVTVKRNPGSIRSRNLGLIPNARNLRWRQSLASNISRRLRHRAAIWGLTTWRPTLSKDCCLIVSTIQVFSSSLWYTTSRQYENIPNCTRMP